MEEVSFGGEEYGGRPAGLGFAGFCRVPASQYAGNLGCKTKCESWTVPEAGRSAEGSRVQLPLAWICAPTPLPQGGEPGLKED